jgi:CRP/FNR family transcriptional regulator, cyclic AMP receptor protein
MHPEELKSVPLFASLNKDELRFVAQQADEIDVPAGKQLATEGRFAYEFFIIENGTAEVTRDGAPIATLGPGDFFGEIGLLESERRVASVVAQSSMRLIVLTGGGLRMIERQMPSVGARIREAVQRRSEANERAVAAKQDPS